MNTYEFMVARRVFPISFFNYSKFGTPGGVPGAVADWVDCGINLPQLPNFVLERNDKADVLAMLDAVAEAGCQAIVLDTRAHYPAYKTKGEEGFRQGLAEALADWGSHPATFGLEAGDEASQDNIWSAYRTAAIHREMAPELTHFMSFGGYSPHGTEWMQLRSYRRYLDDFCEHADPRFIHMNNGGCTVIGPDDPIDGYFRATKMIADGAQRNGTRFWVTLLCAGHFNSATPTEDQLRWQVNTAAACGAQGIAWFLFYMQAPHANYTTIPIDEHWERTRQYTKLSRVNRTFQKMHGPTLTQLKFQKTFHVHKAYGGYPGTVDSEIIKSAEGDFPFILTEFKDREGRDYVAVVNNTHETNGQARITWHGQPTIHRIGWESKEAVDVMHKGRSKDPDHPIIRSGPWLAPGQMELYRVDAPLAKP